MDISLWGNTLGYIIMPLMPVFTSKLKIVLVLISFSPHLKSIKALLIIACCHLLD